MEDDLIWLKALLVEHGGMDRVTAIERAAREEIPPLDTRGELSLVLDELEGILVHGFKTVAVTMAMLKAEKLIFLRDPAIDYRREASLALEVGGDADRISISHDTLDSWGNIAAEANELINEFRRSYDL